MIKQSVKLFRVKKEPNEKLEAEVEKIMSELRDFFEINWIENVPKIFFLESRDLIDQIKGYKSENWVTGWADRRIIYLLDQDKFETESSHNKISDKEYRALIKHELAHAFYAIKSGEQQKPRWLNEGVSIYSSGQLEFKKGVESFKVFLDFYDKVGPAIYGESGWVIKLLVDKFGKEKLLELLKEIKESKPDEEGFKKIFEKLYGIELSYESFNNPSLFPSKSNG